MNPNFQDDQQNIFPIGKLANASLSVVIKPDQGSKQGSMHFITDSSYNGTTGTIALLGSNDNSNFTTVYEDDDTTAMSFTLAASSQYVFQIKRRLFKYYKVVYTKGDASAGTITGDFVGIK